jgi:hypothetical protein
MAGKVTRRAVGTVVAVVGACLAYAAVAQVKEAVNSPITLIELWNKKDDECRGGRGGDPRTNAACDARQAYDTTLRAIGWCFEYQGALTRPWHPCAPGEAAEYARREREDKEAWAAFQKREREERQSEICQNDPVGWNSVPACINLKLSKSKPN